MAPYCRIGIYILYSHHVDIRLRLIARMVPELVPIMSLVALFIFTFGWIGVLLFPNTTEEGHLWFNGLGDGMWSLLVLITTANFPDIMMPAYKENRESVLFFLAFVMIGVFLLVNVVTAVVFNSFTSQKERHFKEKHSVRTKSRNECFNCLTSIERNPTEVGLPVMRELFKELTHYQDIANVQDASMEIFMTNLDKDKSGTIERAEFDQVFEVLESSVLKPTFKPPFLERNFPKLAKSGGWIKLKLAVRSPRWDYMIDAVLIFAIGLAFAESCSLGLLGTHDEQKEAAYRDKSGHWIVKEDVHPPNFSDVKSFAFWNVIVCILFIIEGMIKVAVYGFAKYWSRLMNRWDFIITCLTSGVTLYAILPNDWNNTRIVRLASMLRVGRVLRLLFHASPTFRVTANTFVRIIPDGVAILKVLFCAMFIFSFVGMQLFGGVINTDPASPYSARIADTDFATADYYANNFNDMASGMVTLFELLVVNNWFEIVDGFSAAVDTQFAAVFFVIWYIFGVLITMNIVVSFILNAFVDEFEQGMLSVGGSQRAFADDADVEDRPASRPLDAAGGVDSFGGSGHP